jgi:cytochrome c oxidase subunit 2
VGLQLPQAARRLAVGAAVGLSLLMLAGCSEETKAQADRWAMPANSPATIEGHDIASLWKYAWIAALITGVIVWSLIFYVAWRYRRRHEDEIPVQTRYNLPLEIFYTIAPIMMVIVLFYWTVTVQNRIKPEHPVDPDLVVDVVGQQWQWTFNHAVPDSSPDGFKYVYEAGTARYIPTLVLPVDETVRFNLSSPDVIHSFWVPAFLMKMDVVPGRANFFQVTPNQTGWYDGKCTELCGVYHSRMLFNVHVVTQTEYQQYLQKQINAGYVADTPLLGGAQARTVAGLESEEGGQE